MTVPRLLVCLLWLTSLWLTSLGLTPLAQAHDFSRSHSYWNLEDNVLSGRFVVQQREATRVPAELSDAVSLDQHFLHYLHERISVVRAGQRCRQPDAVHLEPSAPGYITVAFTFICPGEGALTLEIKAFHDLMERHVHVAQVEGPFGKRQLLFDKDRQHQPISLAENTAANQSVWQLLSSYLVLGAQHVLSGPDHLAFLLMLLLIAATPSRMLTIVLGFTLGHSLSLSLAYLDLVRYNSAAVEALIGFTLLLATMEYVGRHSGRLTLLGWLGAGLLLLFGAAAYFVPAAIPVMSFLGLALFSVCYLSAQAQVKGFAGTFMVTALFGFIHGFGFAGILKEMTLSGGEAIVPLVGFNLGVEVGQVVFAAAVLSFGWLLARSGFARIWQLARLAVIPVVAGLGSYWFMQRLWV